MKKIWHVYTWISYRLKSRSVYKTHSPFVYEFIEKVLRNKQKHSDFKKLDAYKKKVFDSRTPVETVDFGSGAGNKDYVTFTEEVGKIAKRRTHNRKQLETLFRLTRYFKPKTILELGTATGISSLYLKKGHPEAKLITMEGCAGLAHISQKAFTINHVDDIEILTGNFNNTLPELMTKDINLGMVFFDGNHQYKPTMEYFRLCLPKKNQDSVFIFDDIYWSQGMTKAWNEIKQHPDVRFTIDLYWMGLVFFKPGFEKQNFIIRY